MRTEEHHEGTRSAAQAAILVAGAVGFAGPKRYTDAALWERDFEEWWRARQRWAREHRVKEADLPATIGDCPWDESQI